MGSVSTYRALYHGVPKYLSSKWNLLDLAAYTGVLFTLVLLITGRELHLTHVSAALTTVLLWVRVLQFLSGFPSTAWLIRVIGQVLKDMRSFMIVVFALLFAFMTAFALLFASVPHGRAPSDNAMVADAFGTEWNAAVSTFGMIFYAVDVAIFEQATYPALCYLLFFVYTLVQSVILLNLLIAIMSDSYEKVQERARIEGRTLFVETMLENEREVSKVQLANGCTTNKPESVWIHVLTQDNPAEDEWSGIVTATVNKVKGAILPLQEQLRQQQVKEGDLEERMKRQEQKLDSVLELLQRMHQEK